MTSRLDHPNIVRVLGGCLRPPKLFVVQELAIWDLDAHIHGKKAGTNIRTLALKDILSIALDIIRGLVRP